MKLLEHLIKSCSGNLFLLIIHVHIWKLSSIVNETWENIPSNLTYHLNPLPFLLLQHKSLQENNKQMSRMGTVPSESCQALRQASLLRFPGKNREGRPELDSPRRGLEPEKPDKNHRYLSLSSQDLSINSTHLLAQAWTQTRKTRWRNLFL